MKAYRLIDRLLHDGKAYEPGDAILLADDDTAAELIAVGVIKPDPVAQAESIGAMTVAQLHELAKAEGVTVDEKAKKADIIAAIEAARIAKTN